MFLSSLVMFYRQGGFTPVEVLELLPLLAQLLDRPSTFQSSYSSLVQYLFDFLQPEVLLQANGRQLADVAEACVALNFRKTGSKEFLKWHASGVLRVGTAFQLQDLARVRDAYGELGFLPEGYLKQLLGGVSWRLRLKKEKEEEERKMEEMKLDRWKRQQQRQAALHQKKLLREKRARSRKKQRELEEKEWRGPAGMEPSGRANWRSRKMKPPGTLDKQW
jgi:hypothetical protein